MAIAYDAEIEAVDAFASDVGSWWNWLSTEQLSFSHFVALSFLVAVVMYALSVFAQYRRAQERTMKARRIGAYIGAEGVTHVSQAVVCTEVVAVGRCPPPAPTPLEYEGTLLHRPVAATPRKHQSSVRLSTSHTASSATLPPSALKDTTAKRKQASVVWADDVFKLAADARQVSASAGTSASAITSTIGAPYDVLPPIGYSLAQDAAPHQSVLQPSSRHHQISSSTDSSDSDREGSQPSPSSQTGRRDNRSRSSSYAQQQRRSSSKENQRLSRRSTAARAARAGKISLLAGNADVMANSVLTKSTVSPTLTASPLAFAASSLPPLHVGASAISTVLDASSVPTRRCVDGAFEAAPPASSSFATGSHRVSVAHGRRSPIAKDDEPVDFSHVYEEDWAKRLGCSAPPRRQHRRESALQDSYAASDDASTSAARGDASTSSLGYPSGLGVFCTTTPPPHSSTFAPARSTAGAALQAITGLDFTAVERPLPPLIARLPTPPPQPVVTSVQERVSVASTTPSKAIPTLPNVSATRTSTLGFGQRPGAPPPPLAVGGAFQRPSDAPLAVGTVAAPPPSDTIAPAKVEAVAVAASAPAASQSSAPTPEPSAADAPTAAPVTDAESTSKSTLDSDGFKVPSPVTRPAVAAPSPTAPPSLPASAPRPPQPFKALASIPQAPPQRPPRYSDPDDAESGATSSNSTTSSAAAPAGTKTTPPPSFSAAGVRGPFGPTTSPAPSAAPSLWGKAPNQSPFPPKGIAGPSGNTSTPSGSLFAGLKPQPSQSPLSALKPALTAPALGVASPWGTQQPSGLPHRSRSSSGGSSSGGGSPRAGGYLSSGGRGGGGRGGGGRGGSPNYRGEGSARRRQ